MMWELVILYGITRSGIGGNMITEVKSEKICSSMLNNIIVSDGGKYKIGEEGVVIAFCKPK